MEEKIMAVESSDLVVVKQLPIIEDRLDEAHAAVQARLAVVASLAVTEENYKEIKKVRADLNKEFSELETLRKKVKKAVEAPYVAFESGAYRRMAETYKAAIGQVDAEIKDVETGLKDQRRRELFDYFEQYRQSLGLDASIADPYRSGIKVGLTGTMKALKTQVREYLDRIDGDLKMIDTLDDRDEVLSEYRVSLNVTDAVRLVSDRKKRVAEERARREADEQRFEQKQEQIAEVDAVLAQEAQKEPEAKEQATDGAVGAPTVSVPEEESDAIYSARYLGYEIFGTINQLKALKAFLKDELKKYLEKEGMNYGEC